ncbi:MAG TPA: Fe-S cluster assembly protein SufD [Thermoanaerobaculia bacterium]|jgi:Fe-S cluster assembly protein SufD|nr:Fe-S cluster assembly protein SufD [Thermoanaerobaculia bacterium]
MTTAIQQDVREQAAERFRQLGWPTTRLEEWKYTNVAPIARSEWKRASSAPATFDTQGMSLQGRALAELVFVNGHYVGPALQPAPPVVIKPIAQAPEEHYARYADYAEHPFTALNTANAQDGAYIHVQRAVEGFIHLLFIGTDGYESHPRNLIVAERGAQLSVVETFIGAGKYFTNAVTELVAKDGAVIEHTKIESESLEAFHIGTLQIHQERSSSVTSHCIATGGALVRNEINAALTGQGASVVLDGLFAPNGTQHIDNHTVIDHATPHCDSLEFYKGVLDGHSRGIFDGKVIVRPDAQKTVSRQVNNNLLLSETAIVDSKPTLEILNDDVKCNHGSTIGQLEEEPMFYLRSRGIGEEEARSLLVHAFAGEIIDRLKIEPVREQVRRALFAQLKDRLPERRERGR